ncbi:MAG: DUF3343 domain-containing protein [Treponema sp.]|jgi:hypothetical protein|nr:DUF3343 domain-containing protein [Treponema sp.]
MEGELIFTFRNAHEAIMGERRLLDAGLGARAMPVPKALGKSCGIALRVAETEAEKAALVLGEDYLGVFCRAAPGRDEFVPWNRSG